ncbi:hypothetical protein ACO0RG_001468 [Hanseniaspora osmophila]|uniref:Non-histone protein 10 n=1 Tax=Hanseniaspora osmophila TaxID=56408 RepID=A0A1E5R0U1_9ASCO|nr:Non-histone protein 10 [Hanseniaspora osmophila]
MTNNETHESLKQKITQIQDTNEVLALSVQRTRLSVRRLRFEYAVLLERLQQRVQKAPLSDCEDPLPTLKDMRKQLDKSFSSSNFVKNIKSSNNLSNAVNGQNATENTTLYSKRKLARMKRDPKMPKRPTNAYLFFCENNKEQLREDHGPQADMSRVLTEAWKSLSDEDKKPYFDMYNEDKIRYQREMAEYTKEKESENENENDNEQEEEYDVEEAASSEEMAAEEEHKPDSNHNDDKSIEPEETQVEQPHNSLEEATTESKSSE